ncbi:MAG: envelope biogenesis factor ElyC [Bradymonadaceae bacterium]
MFLIKKILGHLFMPLSVIILLLLVGLAVLWFTRREKLGKVLVTGATVLLMASSCGLVADGLLRPFERQYSTLHDASEHEGVEWIIVLGAGHFTNPELPVTSQVAEEGLIRLAEGIRLHRQLPGSKLVFSGDNIDDPRSVAEAMGDVARSLGVPDEDMLLLKEPRDTAEEVEAALAHVGEERIIVVTEASHMPRAMYLFERAGMNPIAAPTGHRVSGEGAGSLLPPRASHLRKTERGVYEFLGNLWVRVSG